MSSPRLLGARSSFDATAEPVDDVVVEANGVALRGWKSVSITRRMDAAAGSFSLTHEHVEPWPIRAGAEVRILVGNAPVMTGYVDEIRASLEENSATLEVSGRDRTADLVDCSVPEDLSELRLVTLGEIAERLAAPLGIKVRDELVAAPGSLGDALARFDVFRFNPGETCWTAIERACRLRQQIAYTDAEGRLRLTRPAVFRADTSLVYGSNLKRAELEWTQSDRFQLYVVKGQRPGSDDEWGAAVAEIRGEARDLAVERPRLFVKVAERIVDQRDADGYASWLATVRAARASSISAQLLDWRQTPGGRLWEPDELVSVQIPRWRIAGDEFLVNAVRLQYPPRLVTLELVRADAYKPEPVLEREDDPFEAWGDDDEAPDLEEEP